jgi:D-tagatose-1,6-bisphosphate aldolase subunit GatZ/KbaZ
MCDMHKNGFSSGEPLQKIIRNHKQGQPVGIYSICSAHREVLCSAMQSQKSRDDLLLIESTCNQVNQEGGYSGMTPERFVAYVQELAREVDFPTGRILLGGDHLGPNPWRREPASLAMGKAGKMVQAYVASGYLKIHLDASMPCGDEAALSDETVAERSAQLCLLAERAASESGLADLPLYVIGTEVPSPGGMAANQNEVCSVTRVDFAERTVETFQRVFHRHGLEEAFQRIIALVISPGVEFNDKQIFAYDRSRTAGLREFIETIPHMVYEAHSTDYQTPQSLKQMVQDHFAILKVGPALTFAFREAVFHLAAMEEELLGSDKESRSHIVDTLLETMQSDPSHWEKYYTGSESAIRFALKYSFSDRVRYYWGYPAVQKAYQKLITNLHRRTLPLSLISQYFPHLFPSIRDDTVKADPAALILANVAQVLKHYQNACGSI